MVRVSIEEWFLPDTIYYAKDILQVKASEHKALVDNVIFCLLGNISPIFQIIYDELFAQFQKYKFYPLLTKDQTGFF